MLVETFVYLFFSLSSLFFSTFVVISKNPIHSVLSLIIVFFNISILLFFLGAEFLGMLFIIVYVGAVAVLFLFVIMLLNIKIFDLSTSIYRYFPIFFFLGIFFELSFFFNFNFVSLSFLDFFSFFDLNFFISWDFFTLSFNNIYSLGFVLYTYHFYHFVVSGVILLVSMLGAISLTLHRRSDVKRQFIYKQIQRDFASTIVWKI